MDSINPLNRLAAIIKQEATRNKLKLEGKFSQANAEKSGHGVAKTATHSLESLRGFMATKVRAIPPDDPLRSEKIVRVFVEQTLLWKFGTELINDAQFVEMVDEISRLLDQDGPVIERYLTESFAT